MDREEVMIKERCGESNERWSNCKYWNYFINIKNLWFGNKSPENCLYYNNDKCPYSFNNGKQK
mgnify:CR=1 FL=1